MATAGQTTTPNFGYNFSGVNTDNQVATGFNTPEAGTVNTVHVYMGGQSGNGAVSTRLVIWDQATGNVLWQSAAFSAAQGSGVAGGQAWQVQTVVGGLFLAAGAAIWVGFWRDPAGHAEFSIISTGGARWDTATPSSGAANFGTLTTPPANGSLGAFWDYTPSAVQEWDGSAWQNATALNAFDGSAEQVATVFAFDGTAWQQVG